MFEKATALAAAMVVSGTLGVEAATVDATHNVIVQFDLSAVGDITFDRSTWRCGTDPVCSTPDGLFDLGNDFTVRYGTAAGLADIGMRSASIAGSGDTDRISGTFVTLPTLFVGASVDSLFATILYTGDVFNVGVFNLDAQRVTYRGVVVGQQAITPVPLPASLPVMIAALGGVGLWRRRRNG